MKHYEEMATAFAAHMKAARERRGWSQAELARRMNNLGVKWYQATVFAIEKGERRMQLAEALAVSEVLHLDLSTAILGDDPLAQVVHELTTKRTRMMQAVSEYCRVRRTLTELMDCHTTDGPRSKAEYAELILDEEFEGAIRTGVFSEFFALEFDLPISDFGVDPGAPEAPVDLDFLLRDEQSARWSGDSEHRSAVSAAFVGKCRLGRDHGDH